VNRETELAYLLRDHRPGGRVGGDGLTEVTCSSLQSPQAVIDRCREVLIAVLTAPHDPWPSDDSWASLLPRWFVEVCPPEGSAEDEQRWLAWWRTLPWPEQYAVSEAAPWSLPTWIYWLQPDERQWFWVDAHIVDETHFSVAVEVSEWPAPLGALKWLIRAADSDHVEV
jgi:hypothetical protein